MKFMVIYLFSISALSFANAQIKDTQVCALYLNLDTKKLSAESSHCNVATAPCSTFKIPIAATALKFKKITQDELFQWDQIKRDREVLNKNHNLQTWLKDSVVWVSSIIVDRLGRSKLQEELKLLKYGNSQVGPKEFWLNGQLKISPHEQITYLSRNDDAYLNKTFLLLPPESANDFTVYGKTGSCSMNENGKQNQIG